MRIIDKRRQSAQERFPAWERWIGLTKEVFLVLS